MHGVRTKDLLALNFKDNEPIKVSPVGEIVGLDGRGFKIDAEALLHSIQSNNLHIPLDENHSFGGAVGWFDKDSFEIRKDGIYAKLELNKTGKTLIEDKVYRYLSPVYDVNGRNVTALDSVGLVNRPNLLNNTINSKHSAEADVSIKGENMNEIDELKAQLEKLKKDLDEGKAANEALKAELEKAKKEKEEPKGDEAGKDQDKPSTESNKVLEELSAIGARMAKMEENFKGLFGKADLEKNTKGSVLSDDEMKVAKLLGLSEEEYKGGK